MSNLDAFIYFITNSRIKILYYVGSDSLPICLYHLIAHKQLNESISTLFYDIHLPFYLKATIQLFLFAKTLNESLAFDVLIQIMNNIKCRDSSSYVKTPISELFNLRNYCNPQNVCRFKYEINENVIDHCICNCRTMTTLFNKERAWNCQMVQAILQMKFTSSYQPLILDMISDKVEQETFNNNQNTFSQNGQTMYEQQNINSRMSVSPECLVPKTSQLQSEYINSMQSTLHSFLVKKIKSENSDFCCHFPEGYFREFLQAQTNVQRWHKKVYIY